MLPAEEDDATIIASSRARPEMFAAIFARHSAHIHRYLARRLGPEAAEDLVGETFLTAFGKRATYRLDRRDARPWLYGIAANLVAGHRRDEVRRLRLWQSDRPEPDQDCHADQVAHRVSAQAHRQPLALALAQLSAADREVLLLIAWEELSYAQVAEAMSIPVGTVRSRLNRARRKVRKSLGGIDPSAETETIEVLRHG
jgi:RNA polymerase sigma factor (sigma-70 family)